MLRVAFVVHRMYVAGAEVLVAQTIRELGSQIEPTIFCLDETGPLGEQLRSQGVEVVDLQRNPHGVDWPLTRRMAEVLREREIQVIHAHQYTPFFYAALARLRGSWSSRLILTEHGRNYPDVVSWKRRWANRLLMHRFADRVNACCEFSIDALVEKEGFPRGRIEVLRNGVELAKLDTNAEPPSDLPPRKNRRVIAMVARFNPIKNHPLLLRGFQQVIQQREDVDLWLIGDGQTRSELEQLCDDLQIRHRVHFLGVRSDVPAILPAVDVVALTSHLEAAPLVLLEAMAASRPVVATNVGGNPEMVRHGENGYLVPTDDPSSLATAFLELLDNPQQATQMGKNGRALVEREYQLHQTIGGYYQLYRELVESSLQGELVLKAG